MAKTKAEKKATKPKPEQKRGKGQPTLYRFEYCEKLISHMKSGMSFPSYAAEIDVNPDTLYEWAKVHPDFSEAKKKGEAHSLAYMERVGLLGMTGKMPGFNFSAWIASMNNKHRSFGWRRGDAPVSAPGDSDELKGALEALDAEERDAATTQTTASSRPKKQGKKPADAPSGTPKLQSKARPKKQSTPA